MLTTLSRVLPFHLRSVVWFLRTYFSYGCGGFFAQESITKGEEVESSSYVASMGVAHVSCQSCWVSLNVRVLGSVESVFPHVEPSRGRRPRTITVGGLDR